MKGFLISFGIAFVITFVLFLFSAFKVSSREDDKALGELQYTNKKR